MIVDTDKWSNWHLIFVHLVCCVQHEHIAERVVVLAAGGGSPYNVLEAVLFKHVIELEPWVRGFRAFQLTDKLCGIAAFL